MNITMLHDLDTGFLAATLKPAFERQGHTVSVLQTITTQLENDTSHIDILLSNLQEDHPAQLKTIFENTDFFILRSLTDTTLRLTGVLPYITPQNTIWRVHGSEMRERNVPYSLRTWQINWHHKEPILVGPRDPSLMPLYHKNTVTTIERPCNFAIFPHRRVKDIYALHTPTRVEKKGTQQLFDNFNKQGSIPLHIISGSPRDEILKWKAGASFFIDYLGSYNQGPYGMNTVEAWYYNIPVLSQYKPMDVVMCPEVERFVIHATVDTIPSLIKDPDIIDRKTLRDARNYALTVHNPQTIAKQYLSLAKHIGDR